MTHFCYCCKDPATVVKHVPSSDVTGDVCFLNKDSPNSGNADGKGNEEEGPFIVTL